MPDLLDAFKQGLAEERKERKSNDIVDFMRTSWKLFCRSSSQMRQLVEELQSRDDLSPTSLADALGLDPAVMFKKMTLADAARTALNLPESDAYKQFQKVLEQRRTGDSEPELCVVLVSGHRSAVITNMPTVSVVGKVRVCVPQGEGRRDIEMFPIQDARERMPRLFTHEETDYE